MAASSASGSGTCSITSIAGALSFLPGGLGVTEGTMTILLVGSATGVDQPTALTATLLMRLATLWFAVLMGLILLLVLRFAPQGLIPERSARRP